MRWRERQERVEAAVYDCIDELAAELDVEVPYYPAVFWVGRTLCFEDLGMPESKQASFELRRAQGVSYFSPRDTILINSGSDWATIREEASHFVHFSVSGASFSGKPLPEALCLRIIAEMLGLLGARILGSGKRKYFDLIPDLMYLSDEEWQKIADACPEYIRSEADFCEFYACQQGYGLGDRIYHEYLAGRVPLKFIRNLFLDPLSEKDSATGKFIRLKNRFWPAS